MTKPKRKPASARVWVAVDPVGSIYPNSVAPIRASAIKYVEWNCRVRAFGMIHDGADWRAFYRAGWRVKRATLMPPHALRHSWASWFYAATRDAIRLKEVGGWSSLELVDRYTHLMPRDAVAAIALVWGCASPDDFPAAAARRIGTPLTRGIAAGG